MRFLCSPLLQISALSRLGLCPKLKLVNTTHANDESRTSRCRPDISIYSELKDIPEDAQSRRYLDWKMINLWMEDKNQNEDIFYMLADLQRDEKAGDLESHICWTNLAYKNCGQLIAYATELHHSQLCVFSFAIFFFGATCRLLWWDCSGVIYTEPLPWASTPNKPNKNHTPFLEFLWRMNFLSDADCGYDTTVTSVEDDVAEAALSKLRAYSKDMENIKRVDLHKFLVYDDCTTNGQNRRSYITGSAIWDSKTLFGRSTFGYIAYDVKTSNLVYLKDFWHTDVSGIQKEGDVYEELHKANVPHIPVLGPAGNVPLFHDQSNTTLQRTKTQDYVKGSVLGHDWCPGRPHVDPYVHY